MVRLRGIPTAPDDPATATGEDLTFLPDRTPLPVPSGPAPSPAQPVTAAPDEIDLPDKKSPLEEIYRNVAKTDPTRAASVLSLAQRLDEPESFIDRNLDQTKKVIAEPHGSFFTELENQYPGTSKFLQDPRNMAVTHDDLPNVRDHEGLVNHLKDAWNFEKSAFQSGALQEELAFTRYRQLMGDTEIGHDVFRFGSPAAQLEGITATNADVRAEQISKRLEELNKDRPEGFLKRGIYGATEFLPQIAGGLGYGVKYAAPAVGAAALAGAATGPGELALVPAAATVGLTAGAAEYNYSLMTGMAYDQLSKVKDANDNPLPATIAKPAAIAMGVATAGLSFVKLNALLDSVPGGKEFLTRFAETAGEKVLQNPATYKEALKGFATNYVQAVSHGVAAMEGITAVNIAGTEAAKTLANQTTDQQFRHVGLHEAVSELATTGVDALATFGVMGALGPMTGLGRDLYQARKAEQTQAFLTALGDKSKDSKLKQRLPEKYQELVSQITKDGPVENVYIPVEAAEQYFQNKNIPTDQAMAEIGVTQSYTEAKATGGDVKIPLAVFTDKLAATEHYQGLMKDLKFDPEDMTQRQVEARKSEIEQAVKDAQAQAEKEATPEVPATPAAPSIADQIGEQLKAAGLSATEARINPKLHEAFFTTLGKALGEDPQKLAERYPLKIERPAEVVPTQERILEQPKRRKPAPPAELGAPHEQFKNPEGKGDISLPRLNEQELDVLGAGDKPVIIKERVATKNKENHGKEIPLGKDAEILRHALYEPTHILQSKAQTKPDRWNFIHKIPGTSDHAVLEVKATKDHYEVINWHPLEEEAFQRLLKRTEREGGQVLITERGKTSQGAAALSALPPGTFSIPETLPVRKERLNRAEAMGFKTSEVWYHGTPGGKFDEFHPGNYPGIVAFFTKDERFADKFARDEYYNQRGFVPEGSEDPQLYKVFSRAENTFEYANAEHLKLLRNELKKSVGEEKAREIVADFERADEEGTNWTALEDPEIVEAVKRLGFDSMFVEEEGRKNLAIFEPNQVRSVDAAFLDPDSPKLYAQASDEGPRGRIRFATDGSERLFNIDLLKKADRSTFLHESGHYFLEVLGDLASAENAPELLKRDYKTLLDWFGIENKDAIGTEHHEKFARGFEAYLMEGKAPTPALQKAFNRFRDWLTKLYKDIRNLNVDLTDDVRGVMDRMLATQEEIDRAHKTVGYDTEAIPGLTPEIEAKIRDLQDQARHLAENELLKPQMEELKGKRQEFLKAERERLTGEAEKQVKALPLYSAIEELNSSTGRNDATARSQRFLKALEKGEGAEAEFESQAEIHGFASGEELARKIVEASDQGSFRKEVKALVDAGMAEHADLKDSGKLREEALKAIHNDKMTELLALEREALVSLVDKAATRQEVTKRRRIEAAIAAAEAKRQAAEILNGKPLKDAANSRIYITAERKAAVNVAKALAKKDYAAAAEAKRQQMLNHALASEAIKNADYTDKATRFLDRFASRGNDFLGMPYGFIRQIDQLLSRSGFADERVEDTKTLQSIAQSMAEKRADPSDIANASGLVQDQNGNWTPESLPAFVARANDEYRSFTIPDSVLTAAHNNFRDLTVPELRDLRATVEGISGIGKSYDRFLGEFKTLDMKEAAAKFRTSVAEKFGRPYAKEMAPGSPYESKFSERLAFASRFPAALSRMLDTMLTTCHKFDGLVEGPAKDHIYRPLNDASNRKMERTGRVMKELDGLYAEFYKPNELAEYKDTRIKLGETFFSKDQILSMALNWGNEGNRSRLMAGTGYGLREMNELFSHLGKKDWDFAQATWNHIDKYWPEIAQLEMDVNGHMPTKVEAARFSNEHGDYAGGYYPIVYDFAKSADAYQNALKKDALYKTQGASHAATDQGHAQARVAFVGRQLRLSLDVIREHHENVIHDLEFRKAVIDVSRFLRQTDTKAAITEAVGVKGYAGISDWVKAAAGAGGEPLSPVDQLFRNFRFKTTFFNLGYRIVSAPKIAIENLVNLSSELGISGTARAIKNYMTGDGMHEMVISKSQFMKDRANHLDRDLSDITKKYQGEAQGNFRRFAFYVHAALDQTASFPLWNDTYQRAINEHGKEKLAVQQADESVKRTFMSGSALDQAGVMRGGEKMKAMTTAYGYQSMMWNRFSRQMFEANRAWAGGDPLVAARVMAHAAVYTFMMPALTAAVTREFLRNTTSEDQEARDKRMTTSFLEDATPLKFIPILRDISPYMLRKSMGEHVSGLYFTPLETAAMTVIDPAMELFSSNKGEKFPEHMANAASLMVGVPKEINDLTFNFIDWTRNNGELTWRDFISRRTKK
jgi:hypothetical protein